MDYIQRFREHNGLDKDCALIPFGNVCDCLPSADHVMAISDQMDKKDKIIHHLSSMSGGDVNFVKVKVVNFMKTKEYKLNNQSRINGAPLHSLYRIMDGNFELYIPDKSIPCYAVDFKSTVMILIAPMIRDGYDGEEDEEDSVTELFEVEEQESFGDDDPW
jgi:hypothetical protein